MPLEKNFEHDRYGHLLPQPVRLSDGTDISRMTVEQIKVHQRKLSPKYPDVATALLRRQMKREAFTARILMALAVAGMVYGFWNSFGFVAAGFCSVGFIVTCIVAGNRAYHRAGGGGNPF